MDPAIENPCCDELLSFNVTPLVLSFSVSLATLMHLPPRSLLLTDVHGHQARRNQSLCPLVPTPLNAEQSSLKGENGEFF